MPFSLPRLLSKLQSVITIDTANNDLRIANAVVFSDGTRQTTAGVAVDQFARDTANGANGLAAGAFTQANTNATNITLVNQYAESAYAQSNSTIGVDATQNTRLNSIETINTEQNTSISIVQGVNNTQNVRLGSIETINADQNTSINIIQGVNATQNVRLNSIETVNTEQNTAISIIQGVDATQNTRITEVNDYASAAYAHANTKFASSGGTITGSVTVTNDLTVNGNVSFVGNVTSVQVTGNTGQFFGYAANGFNALYAGIPVGFDIQPSTVVQATSDSDSFAQINHQNINSGTDASTDFVATADNGNEDNTFIDIGINSSTYNNPDFSLTGPNDGYVYVHGNTDIGGGNLIFATMHQNDIIFAVQGQQTENEVMRITSANNLVIRSGNPSISNSSGSLQVQGGVGVAGNVYSDKIYTDGIFYSANGLPFQMGSSGGGGTEGALAGWSVIDSNYTVGNNVQLIANTTTAGFTITLPAFPSVGNTVVITDGSITSVGWSNNSVTVARNGSTILGYADDLALNISRSTATLVYDGGTWQVSSTVGPKGDTGSTGPAGATGAAGPAGAGANATQRNYRFNATNNQTIFVGADAYSQSLSYNVNAVSVYLNGVFLRPTDDYVANNGTIIYLNSGTFANDALDVVAFESMSLTAAQNTITTYVYNASAGQTSFGGTDINSRVLDYNPGNIFVTLNGLNLRVGTDYLQSNTSYITLTSGANANDEVSIVAFGSFSVQGVNTQNTISSYYYTSTAGQTSFSGTDIYGQTLSYMPDGLFVVRNGATLRNKIDYTATDGTTVALANPTSANDEIAITAVGWFSVAANGYTQVEANNLFLTKTDANTLFVTSANTYTKAQANTQFASTGKAIAMAIVFGG